MPFGTVGNLVTVVQGTKECPKEEFVEYIELLKKMGSEHGGIKILVRSHGANLNSMQRSQLNILADKYGMRVAVVGLGGMVRAIMIALSWLKKMDTMGFSDTDFDGAFRHLETSFDRREEVLAAVRELEIEALGKIAS